MENSLIIISVRQKNVSFIRGMNKAKKNKFRGSGRIDLV